MPTWLQGLASRRLERCLAPMWVVAAGVVTVGSMAGHWVHGWGTSTVGLLALWMAGKKVDQNVEMSARRTAVPMGAETVAQTVGAKVDLWAAVTVSTSVVAKADQSAA